MRGPVELRDGADFQLRPCNRDAQFMGECIAFCRIWGPVWEFAMMNSSRKLGISFFPERALSGNHMATELPRRNLRKPRWLHEWQMRRSEAN